MAIESVSLPQAIYGCHFQGCADEVSFPPEDLLYVPECEVGTDGDTDTWEEGFYCSECMDHLNFPVNGLRYTLRDVLDFRGKCGVQLAPGVGTWLSNPRGE